MNAFAQRCRGCGILLLLGSGLFIPAVAAQPGQPLFQHMAGPRNSSADEAFINLIEQPTTVRAAFAHVKRDTFDADRILLNIFPDLSFDAIRTDPGFSGAHHRAWFGNLAHNQGSAVFIINGARISGKINSSRGTFEIFPLGDDDCIVVEHYSDKFPGCGVDHLAIPGRAQAAVSEADQSLGDTPSGDILPSGDNALADTPTANRIRILVAYTSSAKSKTLSVLGRTMQEHLDLAIAESNQGYANSGIESRIELACLYQTDFVETYAIENDVDDFRNDGDGKGDEVHQLRADFDADMCSLITSGLDAAWCGYSYGMDYTSRENMFQVTSYACVTSNFSFVHEFGHTQGCRHDSDTTLTPFPYGHGFRNASNWRTIMALSSYPVAPRLNYWSNPDIVSPVLPYTAMGTPVDGEAFANDCRTALNVGDDTVINHETTPEDSTAPTNDAFAEDEFADKVVTNTLTVAAFTADSGSVIQFRAGSSIVLQPGFHAREGSEFHARLTSPLDDPPSTGTLSAVPANQDETNIHLNNLP